MKWRETLVLFGDIEELKIQKGSFI